VFSFFEKLIHNSLSEFPFKEEIEGRAIDANVLLAMLNVY